MSKVKIKLNVGQMGIEPKQNPDNYCCLRERVLRALKKPKCCGYKIHIPNDVAWVAWKYSENNVDTGKNVNVAVSAYLTDQARLTVRVNK